MTASSDFELPPERQRDMHHAKLLEWLTIAYLGSVIVLMYLVMGSSQAMKTAWIEDFLSLIPPIGFLIAARVRYWPPNETYPYGYHRSINIAYLTSALALFAMGLFLLVDGGMKLVRAEHPTIGSVSMAGYTIWLGWLMLPVLVWATVPAFLLGRAKLRIAERLHDKALYADAEMNKADWITGVAAGTGVLGIAWGWWWADAVAAIVISVDIIWDGLSNLRAVVGDLLDRKPKTVDHRKYLDLPEKIATHVRHLDWVRDVSVRLREQGHILYGELFIVPIDESGCIARRQELIAKVKQLDWRVHELSVQFVDATEEVDNPGSS